MMKRVLLTTASLAIALGVGAAGALAGNITQPPPGTVVYGAPVGTPPAGDVAPQAPAGFQNQWVYSYGPHGYYGHWEAVRTGVTN
jgi:hypothetical protein